MPRSGSRSEGPGEVGRKAVQLLVEPVAEPSHRLGEKEARGEGVGEAPEADAGPFAAEPRADRTTDEGAEDRDAALPDVEDRPDVLALAEVEAPVGDDVEDARADDGQGHRQQADVDDDPRLRAALGQAVVGHQRRHDDAGEDAQGVEVDERTPWPQAEAVDGRARDAGDDVHGGRKHEGQSTSPRRPVRSGACRR